MGFERLPGPDIEFVLGDIGVPGVFGRSDGELATLELGLPASWFGEARNQYLFSWAVLADDWDADGDVDLLITFGSFAVQQGSTHLEHRDTVFIRDGDGFAAVAPSGLQLADHLSYPDGATGEPRVSRAAVRFDADLDGVQEVFVAAANGPPFVYRHEDAPPRCTLRPRPRYVVSGGAGYAWQAADGRWWPGPTGGEALTSDPPWILVDRTATVLEFPSGYQVPIDCSESYVVDVVEPSWLEVTFREYVVEASLTGTGAGEEAPELAFALKTDTSVQYLRATRGPTSYRAVALSGVPTAAMVQLNGRWVGRWFEASETF